MTSFCAHASALLGAIAVALVLFGPLGALAGFWSPLTGFALFALGVIPGTVVVLVLGLTGLLRTRRGSGRDGASQAWAGTVMGILLAGVWVFTVSTVGDKPAIHDITTDLEDPPAFLAAQEDPANSDRDLSYPHGGEQTRSQQRRAYPDLAPIELDLSPAEALDRSLVVAETLDWVVVAVDRDGGRFEAYDRTAIFRFTDDVVVRVRPAAGGGSVIDVRSTSRVGNSDLGANADRIRAFQHRLTRDTE